MHPITHNWQKDRHEAAKMAHIATMQYFINIAEEKCGADWLASVVRFCHLWVIGCAHGHEKEVMQEV